MAIFESYTIAVGSLIALSLIDRYALQRRKVNICSVVRDGEDHDCLRFALNFEIKQKLINANVSYTLRDKKDPTTVITGKQRPLDFSPVGCNSEFLLFNKKYISDGEWVLDVKIESFGSKINPFYKISPIVTTFRKEFSIG
ncbi:TPA: hypothetical protein ACX6RX_003228 [Photobacterium damselae]